MSLATARFSDRFLQRLGLARRAPSAAFLKDLVERQLEAVPYENVSKLVRLAHGRCDAPSPEEWLEGFLARGYGGTCFTINAMFAHLLDELGFAVELVGGTSGEGPDSHLSVRIALADQRVALDFGYMLPRPGPFDLAGPSVVMPAGARTFHVEPRGDGVNFRIRLMRGDVLGREFVSETRPRTLTSFAEAIRASHAPERLFMRTLCIHRRLQGTEFTVWNREFFRAVDGRIEKSELATRDELSRTVREVMRLPAYELDEALAQLERNGAPPLF